MKSKQRRLLELAGVIHRTDLLLEEEEPESLFSGGDEGGDDAGGDDAGGDEGGGDEGGGDSLFGGGGDDAGGDEGGEGDEDEKEEKEEEIDPADELSPSEIAKYGSGEIDVALDSVLEDIFTQSIERAKVKSATSFSYPGKIQKLDPEKIKNERLNRYSLKDMLLEEVDGISAEDFDIGFYAGEIARYIKNYDTLLDMEGMIFNKARQTLLNQFGKDAEQEFVELLSKVHNIKFDSKLSSPELSGAMQPLATGAQEGGA